jgi:hypothetical protein
VLQRRRRADQTTPLRRVRLRQEAGDRDPRKCRIAVKGVAVVVGELDCFVNRMQVLRRVVSQRAKIEALEDVQRLEQHRPLIPRSRLVHVESVEVDGDRPLDRAVIRREIFVGEHAAGRTIRVGDASRDVAGVERIASRANGRSPIVRPLQRRALGRDDRAQRLREIRLPEHLADLRHPSVGIVGLLRPLVPLGGGPLADQEITEKRVHRKAVGVFNRRLHHLLEAHRPFGFEGECHRVEHRRDRRSERPVAVDLSLRLKQIDRRRLRRGTLAVDDDHFARLRVVDHRGRFAAEAEVRNLHDRCREHRRHARIHGVAALFEHANAGSHRIMTAGGDDAVSADDFGPHGFRARCDPRRLLGADDRYADEREKPAERREIVPHRAEIIECRSL